MNIYLKYRLIEAAIEIGVIIVGGFIWWRFYGKKKI